MQVFAKPGRETPIPCKCCENGWREARDGPFPPPSEPKCNAPSRGSGAARGAKRCEAKATRGGGKRCGIQTSGRGCLDAARALASKGRPTWTRIAVSDDWTRRCENRGRGMSRKRRRWGFHSPRGGKRRGRPFLRRTPVRGTNRIASPERIAGDDENDL